MRGIDLCLDDLRNAIEYHVKDLQCDIDARDEDIKTLETTIKEKDDTISSLNDQIADLEYHVGYYRNMAEEA